MTWRQGTFREAFHRLAVVEFEVPPPRERATYIPLLIDDLLERIGASAELVSAETHAMLMAYAWPGNVRELRNVVERVVALGAEFALPGEPALPVSTPSIDATARPFKEAKEALVDAFERDYLAALIALCDGNVSRSAR